MGLPESFSRVRFDEPARAVINLARLRDRLPEALLPLLPTILAQMPDADAALNHLERYTAGAGERVLKGLGREPVLLHYLLAPFSHSRTLTETLISQPELILWLGREKSLDRARPTEDLLESYARFEATSSDSAGETDPALNLARFKRREYLRIALKDILRLDSLTETTLELSALADALVGKALSLASELLERRHGWPHTADDRGRPVRSRFAVVSLGKLGGNELNYSSDIDLLFLYDGEGRTAGGEAGGSLAAREFFLRLGQELMRLIAGPTPEGPVYRVDVRLRPGGGEGDLVPSLPAAVKYYRSRAREWERQMLLKARYTAGSAALVMEFERQVEPLLFPAGDLQPVVAAVAESRQRMDRKLAAQRADGVNVKLSPGGIRDIEFLVQCLQRLYGRVDRWVRSRGTLLGLQRLADKGYLSPRDHHDLAAAYQFLRRVEHRLQLDQGQQLHVLPAAEQGFQLLARRCRMETFGADAGGTEIAGEFRSALERHMRNVRGVCSRVPAPVAREPEGEIFRLEPPPAETPPQALEHAPLLQRLRQRSEAVYRAALEAEPAAYAGHSAHARKSFERFLAAAMESPLAFDVLSQSPEVLAVAATMIGWSHPVGELLIRHPEGVEWMAAAETGDSEQNRLTFDGEPSGEEWVDQADFKGGIRMGLPPAEFLSLLRRSHSLKVLQWGVQALANRQDLDGTLRRYSRLACDVLLSVWMVHAKVISGPEIAVIALGRLSEFDLDYGSDLDLVFIASDEEVQRAYRPVIERFVRTLSAHTRDGALYQVDTRLRPEGKGGDLLPTAAGTLEYFRTRAKVWEAAAYLKVSPLHAGHRGFGVRWCSKLDKVLRERFNDMTEIRDELRAMRSRIETEATEGGGGGLSGNFKAGPGGFYDIDFILAFCSFRTGHLRQGGKSAGERITDFARAGALDQQAAATLADSANFYRSVDHAIRLATGSSSPVLPAGRRGEIAAELAGRRLGRPLSAATLATELANQQQRVRAVYSEVFAP